jgi:hypothetical protein
MDEHEKPETEQTPGRGKHSLWERLGKAAGKGLRAAKDAGSRLASEASVSIRRGEVLDRLDDHYRRLGRLAAARLAAGGPPVTADDPEVGRLLGEIEEERRRLEEIEEE